MAWIVQNRLQPYRARTAEGQGPWITEAIRKEIVATYFPRYPRKQAALLPLFHLIMHTHGYIAPGAIEEAAALLEITPADVQDAVSFFEEFRFEPSGKYVVNVCRSIACELCGSEAVIARIKEVFGIENFETTDDGMLTLFEVECIGLCEMAPAALINGAVHGPLTPDGFVATLKALPPEMSHNGHGH